jgi:hypothetical protein
MSATDTGSTNSLGWLYPTEAAQMRARLDEVTAERDALRAALGELFAQVEGECPSLLNEDSGGDAQLWLIITDLLDTTRAKIEGEG